MFAVEAYGFVTLAALAAAVMLKQRALKAKRPGWLAILLPAARDGARIQRGYLLFSALFLGAGVVTGIAAQLVEQGSLLSFDHKTVLSLAALAMVILLLVGLRTGGLRAHQVSQALLGAYLLLTLAYPGVKFVTHIL